MALNVVSSLRVRLDTAVLTPWTRAGRHVMCSTVCSLKFNEWFTLNIDVGEISHSHVHDWSTLNMDVDQISSSDFNGCILQESKVATV